MGRTRELFEDMRQSGLDIDCNGGLYEEWKKEEPNLGEEHSVHISFQMLDVDFEEVPNSKEDGKDDK